MKAITERKRCNSLVTIPVFLTEIIPTVPSNRICSDLPFKPWISCIKIMCFIINLYSTVILGLAPGIQIQHSSLFLELDSRLHGNDNLVSPCPPR